MTEPNPADAGIPLVENGNPAWNPYLQYVPAEKRQEVVPLLQEWDKRYNKLNEEYAPWQEFSKAGVYSVLENQPQVVYESLGQFLGITPKEAKEAVEELEEDAPGTVESIENDPRFQTLKQQVDTLAQITLAQRQQDQQSQLEKQQEQELDAELTKLKKEKGDFPEEEIIMRMLHMDMSPEEAFNHYEGLVSEARKRRPAPFLLGTGAGTIPKPSVDVKSLDSAGRKELMTQMLRHAIQER